METGIYNVHDRTPERTMLWQVEQSRREPSGRDFYWDAQRWDGRLAALIERERVSDEAYQQQIDELVVGSETQIALEQRVDTALHDDISWYERLLRQLRDLRVRWETLGLSNTAHYADLVGHECQVEARLIERRVRLQQLWLENLERRRHRRDGLEPGQWAHYWNYARSVFDDQNQFYVRAYGLPLPARYLDERLDWLTNLRAAQRATLQLWRDDERFDAEGYHADAWEVDQAIAELSPVETGGSGDGAGILVLLFIVGAIALIIGLASNSTASTPQNTGPARATAVAMNNDGMARLKEGRCDEAVPKFEQAASADASFYEPLNNSAFCLYDQGRVDEAIAHWRKALELNLSSADTNAGLGMALYAHGNVDEGRRYYQEAMRIAPRYRDPVWLKSERLWSDRAIVDSAPLRDANGP